MTAVSDKIVWIFTSSGTSHAVTFDRSKAFNKVWYDGHLHKVKSSGILGWIFGLFS